MANYLIRRLLLLPITLFCIVLVNFLIINLAPGDPVTVSGITQEGGAARREDRSQAFGSDEQYLQFREHFGLTLPVLVNTWPWTSNKKVEEMLLEIVAGPEKMDIKSYDQIRVNLGDRARFIMPKLLSIINDPDADLQIRRTAVHFFIRGGTHQAHVGPYLTDKQRLENRMIAKNNEFLRGLAIAPSDSPKEAADKIKKINDWYRQKEPVVYSAATVFFQTRFFRYITRVLTLDFGTLRNDPNKTVISEVTRRFKYSLTLAVLPMFLTFFLCQLFGFTMAYFQNRSPDMVLNVTFLILYAIPVFVVAPFLIERIALQYPSIPISGFRSPDIVYDNLNSYERLFNIAAHIFLPITAIMYGSLAVQSRLTRTAVLEVLRMDYVRTAFAKGLSPLSVLFKHVGRNAAITIITSIAGSLGIILGGALIVETLFEINGFGKFFYDAVINRDYNVIMFSVLAGSFLSLIGYLVADIAYTTLDPRVTLE